jgi:hypothetical protein
MPEPAPRTLVIKGNGRLPAKDPGYSMWSVGTEATNLAANAREAMRGARRLAGSVAVTIRYWRGKDTRDSANIIGGIADALQGWTETDGSTPPQVVRDVVKRPIVYDDDRQVAVWHYTEEASSAASSRYEIEVRELNAFPGSLIDSPSNA